jgi:hypothetical protein
VISYKFILKFESWPYNFTPGPVALFLLKLKGKKLRTKRDVGDGT